MWIHIYSCYSIATTRKITISAFLCIFLSENNTIACTWHLMFPDFNFTDERTRCHLLQLQLPGPRFTKDIRLYSSLKFKSRVPQTWSKRLYGVYDNEKKLQLQLNETKSQAFVSVSFALFSPPPPLLPPKALY